MTQIHRDTKIEELVVIENFEGFAFSLHPIRRRGWVVGQDVIRDTAFISKAEEKGARWVLPLVNRSYELYPITTWAQQLSETR